MSTNYTFYLKQDKPGAERYRQQRKIDNRIFLQTKGFDGKAVDCGKDITEVRHSSRSMSCKRYDDHENTGCSKIKRSSVLIVLHRSDSCFVGHPVFS